MCQATELPAGKAGLICYDRGTSPRRAKVAGVSPPGRGVWRVTLRCQGGPVLGEGWAGAEQTLRNQQVPVQRLPQRARPGPPSDAPLSPPPFPAPWSRGPAHQPCALRSQPRELPLQAGLLGRGVWSRGASLPARCAPQPARRVLAAAASAWAGPPGSTDCLPLSCASTADPLS